MRLVSEDEQQVTVQLSRGEVTALMGAIGYLSSEYETFDTIRLEAGGATETLLDRIFDDLFAISGADSLKLPSNAD